MAHIRYGIHAELEAAANELIRKSLEGVTSYEAKSDILTPWKEAMRRDREVYATEGVVDAAVRQGMYHRAHNPSRPDLNSRDGIARGGRGDRSLKSLQSHVEMFGPGGEE